MRKIEDGTATGGVSGTWPAPARQRSVGRIRMELAGLGGQTRVSHMAESGPLRMRLPRHCGGALEAVLLNTAGGVACGDDFATGIRAGAGTDAIVATPAAERIYKSDGPVSTIRAEITVGPGARVEWLPQETIIYDRARLHRRLDACCDPEASLTLCEMLVFGRAAHGEKLRAGMLRDVWRIRRGSRLVFADNLRLDGDIGALMSRPALGAGMGAAATFVHIASDAEARLEEARDLLAGVPAGICGASAWNGMLVARFLAPDSATLRRAAIPFLEGFRGRPLPRVWRS